MRRESPLTRYKMTQGARIRVINGPYRGTLGAVVKAGMRPVYGRFVPFLALVVDTDGYGPPLLIHPDDGLIALDEPRLVPLETQQGWRTRPADDTPQGFVYE